MAAYADLMSQVALRSNNRDGRTVDSGAHLALPASSFLRVKARKAPGHRQIGELTGRPRHSVGGLATHFAASVVRWT